MIDFRMIGNTKSVASSQWSVVSFWPAENFALFYDSHFHNADKGNVDTAN